MKTKELNELEELQKKITGIEFIKSYPILNKTGLSQQKIKLVELILSFQTKNKYCYMSYSRIADILCTSKSNVAKMVSILKKEGFISTENTKNYNGFDGGSSTKLFVDMQLLIKQIEQTESEPKLEVELVVKPIKKEKMITEENAKRVKEIFNTPEPVKVTKVDVPVKEPISIGIPKPIQIEIEEPVEVEETINIEDAIKFAFDNNSNSTTLYTYFRDKFKLQPEETKSKLIKVLSENVGKVQAALKYPYGSTNQYVEQINKIDNFNESEVIEETLPFEDSITITLPNQYSITDSISVYEESDNWFRELQEME